MCIYVYIHIHMYLSQECCTHIIVNENAISDFPGIDVFNIFIQTKNEKKRSENFVI